MAEPLRRQEPEDRLSATGRRGAVKKMLKIVLILVVIAHAIMGAVWLTGQLRYKQDYSAMRQTQDAAAEAPARTAQ